MLTVSASWPGISSAAYDTFNCGNMFVLIQPFRNLMEICNSGHMEKKSTALSYHLDNSNKTLPACQNKNYLLQGKAFSLVLILDTVAGLREVE